jgi:hypothetical protein
VKRLALLLPLLLISGCAEAESPAKEYEVRLTYRHGGETVLCAKESQIVEGWLIVVECDERTFGVDADLLLSFGSELRGKEEVEK